MSPWIHRRGTTFVLVSVTGLFIAQSTGCGTSATCKAPSIDRKLATRIDTSTDEFRALVKKFEEGSDPIASHQPCIIDIHTHTFNANYLPLPEIVQSRVSNPFTRRVAKAVVRTLQACTPAPYGSSKSDLPEREAESEYQQALDRILGDAQAFRASSIRDDIAEVRDYIRGVGDQDDEAIEWEELRQTKEFKDGVDFLRKLDPERGVSSAQQVAKLRGISDWGKKLLRLIPFLGALGTRDSKMSARYRRDFGLEGDEGPKLIIATQQGSFGETYGGVGVGPNPPSFKSRRYRDYETVLMPATRDLQALPDQDTLFFAAYDPFLDSTKGLELAYEALRNNCAYGFKYYPPSGSRAWDNPDPRMPCAGHKQRAWRARYQESGANLSGSDLDKRIWRFLDWAIECDAPVFTHSNPNEFEADECYGYEFPHPEFWKRFLKSSEERGKLRLCLGHASGPDFWFGTKDEDRPTTEWGPIAAYLAMKYPNVYIEMGIHDAVVEKKERAHFQALLQTLEERRVALGLRYSIAEKLLYGSDWFMPIDVNPKKYLSSYEETFAELDQTRAGGREDWSERFFFRNALCFLNARKRVGMGIRVAGLNEGDAAVVVELPKSVAEDLTEALSVK